MQETMPLNSNTSFKSARLYRTQIAWSIWLVTTCFVLLQFFLQLSSGEIIAGLMKSFSLTAFGGGILASSYYYIYVTLQTPAGMLIDRYGPRGILTTSAAVVCIGSMMFSFAKTMLIALFGRVLMGVGAAFAFVGCLNLIAVWFPARRFALMTAIVETAGMFGAITGNLWVAKYIQQVGWRDCIHVASIFAAILSLVLFFTIKDSFKKRKKSAVTNATQSLRKGLIRIIKMPIAWLNGIYCGFMFGLVTVFIALWAIPFFESTHHTDLLSATLAASAVYVGMAIGGPIIGWLDSKTACRKTIIIVNAIISSALLFTIIFDSSLSMLSIGILLFFTGLFASSYVLTYAIANEIATGDNRATSIGFTNMFCVLFAPFLQPLIGYFITHFKGSFDYFQLSVSIVPFLMLISAGIGAYLPKRAS